MFWGIDTFFRATVTLMSILLLHLFAQSQTKIAGRVMKNNKDALEYANVLLLHFSDSSLIKGAISDKNGRYLFQNVHDGKYLISVSFTGFHSAYTIPFSLSSDNPFKDMGEILVDKPLADLQAVDVIGRKPIFEQKIDRMIINVSGSITYAGGSALEVLERSPGILVDLQNNSLSLNGKDGVIVMINNKINRMPMTAIVQMLAGMSANSIERIELITTPPAGFDAEGNAGYVNIVLKSNTDFGTNGSYAATAGLSRGLNRQISVNINRRKNSRNVFGDFSFSKINTEQQWDVYKKIIYQGKTNESYIDVNRGAKQLLFNGRFGADYTISDKTVLGILFSGYSNEQRRNWSNITDLLSNQSLDTSLTSNNKEINNWYNLSGNINLQHALSKVENISFNLNYDYYLSNNPVEYGYSYFNANGFFLSDHYMQSFKRTPLKIWVAAADYSKILSKKINIEAGAKETLSSFTNSTEVNNLLQNRWQKDEAFSSKYFLKENIIAGYVTLSLAFNSKTVIKSGIRYENTITNLNSEKEKNIVNRHYAGLFPSLFISNSFNEHNALNFSYSRRITRPSFKNLAPTTLFVDPYTYFYGNPALQPSTANALLGSYSYYRKIFSMSFSYESKPITDYLPKINAASNIQSLAAENQKNMITFTSGIVVPFDISKWWAGQVNVSATLQKLNVYINGFLSGLKQQYIMAGFSQTFMLPGDFSFETSGTFNSGGFFGIFYRKPYGSLNAGIQKKFPRYHSTLRFNGVNMVNTQVVRLSLNMPEYNLVTTYKMYFTYPAYRLTYTRNFGNDKLKQARKRITGAEDAKQRVE